MFSQIQLDLFSNSGQILDESDQIFNLMRNHKWAHGELGQLPLVSIELAKNDDQWMWATRLCSRNGAGQGRNALPKWGKFSRSKKEAINLAVDEIRGFMGRATADEQVKISEWLSSVLSELAW